MTGPDESAPPASACPTATNVVAQADGGLARIRLLAGSIRPGQARVLAAESRQCGSETIEITNRANLQVRGIQPGTESMLRSSLLRCGLLRGAPPNDVAGVVCSPTTGLFGDDRPDTLAVAQRIDDALHGVLYGANTGKFGVLVDGGSRGSLRHRPFDLVVDLQGGPDHPVAADEAIVVFGRRCGTTVVRARVPVAQVDEVVGTIVRWCTAAAAEHGTPMRSRAVIESVGAFDSEAVVAMVVGAHGGVVLDATDPAAPGVGGAGIDTGPDDEAGLAPSGLIGVLPAHDGSWIAGAGVALGRLSATQLDGLARLVASHGASELRVTPWRSVLVPGLDRSAAEAVLAGCAELGFATDGHGPEPHVIACAGSTGCAAGVTDAQRDARHILALLRPLPPAAAPSTIHVSGCAKGCASPGPAPITLVGVGPGRYDIYADGSLAPGRPPEGDRVATAIPASWAVGAAAARYASRGRCAVREALADDAMPGAGVLATGVGRDAGMAVPTEIDLREVDA